MMSAMFGRCLPVVVSIALAVSACGGSDDESAVDPDASAPSETGSMLDPDGGDGGSDTTEPTDTTATTDSASGTSAPDTAPSTEDTIGDGASDADVAVEPSPYIGLAAGVVVATDEEVRVEVTATSGDHVVEVPRTAALATEHTVPLVGMRAEQTYDIAVELFDADDVSLGVTEGAEFTTSALPEYFDEHEVVVDAERSAPGFTVVEFDTLQIPEGAKSSQHLMAYDDEGEVVWYYTNTGALAGFEVTPRNTFNVFYWPFGTREVDFLGNVVGNWRPLPTGADPSVITNEELLDGLDPDQVQFQGGVGALVGNEGDAAPVPISVPWIDISTIHHEAWPMPNGNTLAMSTTVHELTPEQRRTFCPDDPAPFDAISDVIVEFEPDGTVVRTWDLWDAIDIDEFPGRELCVEVGIFAEEDTRDWTHANSAVYDPERDAVIVSSRHTDQIVAFDHGEDEGPQTEVRWILGAGATMPLDGEPTYYQHAVEVNDDGSLVVYDNGNFRPGTSDDDPENPPFSRAVIYDVDDSSDDPADWSATQRWEYTSVEESGELAYATFISDADVLENGNVLVTNGGIGTFPPDPQDPLHILIEEVVPEGDSGGDVVWTLRSNPTKMYVTYRAERIPSFYQGDDWLPRS